MATGLGLTVGSMHTVAVTATSDVAPADGTAVVAPTALVLTDDGAGLLPPSGPAPGAVVTGYANRVGDPVALISDDGTTHTGEDLVATTMARLADPLSTPDAVVVAHPAVWTGYQADVLVAALDRAGLPGATSVTEPVAATAWLHHTRPDSADAPVVVYDLGANSLDVTVVGPGDRPEILGTPLRSEDYSGSEFDHATMRYVLDGMAGGTDGLDPFDAGAVAALTELRARCRAAKEALSSDTATVIAVDLPGVQSDVRLVREELEDLIREPLADSVTLVHEAVRSAGLELSDIGLVLLAGGSSAIPLVTELLSAALRLPVVADADPVTTAAAGAARLASERVATTPAARDTAAFAALGAPLTDDVSTVASPPPPPVTSAAPRRARGLSTPKKAALVSAAVAAVVALTAGGLSLGTGAFTSTADSQTTGGITTSQSTTGSVAPGSVSSTSAPGATSGSAAADSTGAAKSGSVATTRTAQAVAGTAAASVPGTTAAAAAADQSTAAASPGAAAATAQNATTQAAAPTQSYNTGEVATGVGQGVGEAAAGVGQGVGGVVSGVGQGVGGVVSGVGGVVGGVGDAVGGVVGGLLGN